MVDMCPKNVCMLGLISFFGKRKAGVLSIYITHENDVILFSIFTTNDTVYIYLNANFPPPLLPASTHTNSPLRQVMDVFLC